MTNKTRRGLGKGFDALLPTNFDNSILAKQEDRIQKLLISDIIPNKTQPRQHFDIEALDELAASIKRHGLLQPIIVTPHDERGKYGLVAGERRWRAAQLAKLNLIPAIVRTAEELEQLEIALVENVQRVDLSPLEQAASIQRLHDQFNMEYEAIGKRLGKAASTLQNMVRLLGLSEAAQTALHQKHISEGHARAILALKKAEHQQELLELIKRHGWSVRQAERYVTAHKAGIKDQQKATARVSESTPETDALSKVLKTPVTIRRMAKGGKLEIGFKTDLELTRLIARLKD